MAKILFEVDARAKSALFAKVKEQAPRRAQYGELSFNVQVDDNARHICYVFLEWESLQSAHKFLQSPASHELVSEWPIEKVLGAIPLRDLGEQLGDIEHEVRRDA
jgi:quinol monooxygenase YgiN